MFALSMHVAQRASDRGPRNLDADVARRAKGDDLTHGDAHVGVLRERHVAPAPGGVLALHGELDGVLETGADLLLLRHAVHLGQREGREGVAVHARVVGGDVARGLDLLDDEVERSVDHLPVRAASRDVAAGQEGQHRERGHPDVGHPGAAVEDAVALVDLLPRVAEPRPVAVLGPFRKRSPASTASCVRASTSGWGLATSSASVLRAAKPATTRARASSGGTRRNP